MAMVVRVKPEHNGKVSIVSNTTLNGTILSDALSPEVLLSIFLNDTSLRQFLFTEYTTASGSYAPSEINPSLFLLHAYDASEITQNPEANYPNGTVGKQLNDTTKKINSISTMTTRPSTILDFSGAKLLPSYCSFSRNSVGSYVDVNGIIRYAKPNQARFTHNAVTRESLGILIEEARTNFATNSNSFSFENLTSSAAIAPDGTNTAFLINQTIGSPVGRFNSSLSYTVNGFYTRSVFVKPNNNVAASIIFEGVGGAGGGGGAVGFDAITRTFSGSTELLIDSGFEVYGNGWIRPWICIERSVTKIVGASNLIQSYGGTATTTQSMSIWGYQLEIGRCATSYISTSGVAVTRSADSVSLPVKYVPQLEGTMLVTGVAPGKTNLSGGSRRLISGSASNSVIGYIPSGTIESVDGSTNLQNGSSFGIDNIAVAYNSLIRKLSSNGVLSASAAHNIASMNSAISIGSNLNITNFLNGTIKRLTIYSRMLTDTELLQETKTGSISSNFDSGIPANSDLNQLAYVDATTILSLNNRQEFQVDGTGASVSRNIRRPYDFTFVIVDSDGVTITSQPAASVLANTNNALVVTAAVGKSLAYAITPVFEY